MKLKFLLFLLLVCAFSGNISAALTDNEDMPVFYLRGSNIGNGNWGVYPEFQFSREGSVYSLDVPSLSGEFKISNEDWTLNYGAPNSDSQEIRTSVQINGRFDGRNFKAEGTLRNVSISFSYNPDSPSVSVISFKVDDINFPLTSGTLPILYINVTNDAGEINNEILDKDLPHKNYFSGNYWLDLNGCEWLESEGAKSIGSEEEPLPLEIKARGNYTRTAYAKKPFKLKLGSKQKLLGLSKSKHFALLAHADDNKGFLRNFIGFNLGKRIGLPWTPAQQPVEVVINGDYRGLYFLTESIRVDSDRVDITELKDNETDSNLASGGYLVELDNYDEDNQIQMEEKRCLPGYSDILRITFDTPEEYSDIQRRFVTYQFDNMNRCVGENSDRLWSFLDLDDAVRYYIVEEMISHVEAYHGSTYLFRDRGENEKWHFSPLWDCGNAFNGPESDFFYRHAPYGSTWIESIRENETFNDHLRKTWLWFVSSRLNGLQDDVDSYISHISQAVQSDYSRWKDAPRPNNGLGVANNTALNSRKTDTMRHFNNKLEWLKSQFGDPEEMIFDEPARDNTPAAPLPDFIGSSVTNIEFDTTTEVRLFNLQGLPVENPQHGNIYIRLAPSGSAKVMF
ncbi:MAG: CotH kinase family protein [Muribaculaceae bacterium]|nr:CotH kinase family protein [Muribaculaceae bacterium]